MKSPITVVVSELIYPPRSGLHGMTIKLLKALDDGVTNLHIYAYYDSSDTDIDLLKKEMSNKVIFFHLGSRCSWSKNFVRILFSLNRMLTKPERELANILRDKSRENIIFEGVGGAGFIKFCKACNVYSNLIDPQSRRSIRLAKFYFKINLFKSLKKLISFSLAYVLESILIIFSDKVSVVSPSDTSYMRRLHGTDKIINIPVCIDGSQGSFHNDIEINSRLSGFNNIFVFVDLTVDYLVYSFKHVLEVFIFPILKENSSLKVKILARSNCDISIPESFANRIELISWVDDLEAELNNADLIILPDLFGTGVKNRTISGLNSKSLVMATRVAIEGIPVVDGKHCLVIDDDQQWLVRYRECLNGRWDYNRIVYSANQLVRDHYSLEVFEAKLKKGFGL